MQHHIGAVLDRVAAGESLTISRHNVPLAQISPLRPPQRKKFSHPDWAAQVKEIYGDRIVADSQSVMDENREERC